MNGHAHVNESPKGVPFQNYQPPNWDEFFMLKVYLTGEKPVMINGEKIIIWIFQQKNRRILERKLALYWYVIDVIWFQVTMVYRKVGYSSIMIFPWVLLCWIGVNDLTNRFERPVKYMYFEHAERNAIFTAARHGIRTEGATLYVQALPCVDCAR